MRNLTLILSIFFSFSVFAQDSATYTPKKYKLEKANDYTAHQQEFIAAVNWLIEAPVTAEVEKRRDLEKFVITWVSGSPTVTIRLNEKLSTYADQKECFTVFLGAWAKHYLENGTSNDDQAAAMAGTNAALLVYVSNLGDIPEHQELEKLLKLRKKKKLGKHIKSCLKK